MTAQTIINNALAEINLANAAIQSSVTLQLLNASGKRLAKKPWPELLFEHEFRLTKDEPYYDLPDDFARIINDTVWDRVESRPLNALNPQQWQEWKSGLVNSQIYKQYRIKSVEGARKLFINPTPTATQCAFDCVDGKRVRIGLAYEYYSKYWAEDSSGDGLEAVATAATDVVRLPNDIVTQDLKWRILRALRMPYADEKFEAESAVSEALAQSGTASVIDAGSTTEARYPNIPETGIGL